MNLTHAAFLDFTEASAIPRPVLGVGCASVAPLVALAVFAWMPAPPLALADIYLIGLSFAAVALSFIAGARWAMSATGRGAFALSLSPPIAGWLALLINPVLGLALLIAAFFLQALANVISAENGSLPLWFSKASSLFSTVAVLALLASLLRLLV